MDPATCPEAGRASRARLTVDLRTGYLQFRRALLTDKDRLKLPRERTPGYAEVATDLAAAVALGGDGLADFAVLREPGGPGRASPGGTDARPCLLQGLLRPGCCSRWPGRSQAVPEARDGAGPDPRAVTPGDWPTPRGSRLADDRGQPRADIVGCTRPGAAGTAFGR